jgi:hypothetical protein
MSKPVRPQTAPTAPQTVPPQMAKVADTGDDQPGLTTGAGAFVITKPTGMTVGGNKK